MINYKHLHYFLLVAKEGSIARASERLHLTLQTISGQLSLLEEQLGQALFNRVGRKLELTETGRLVLSYAEEIFSLGGELEEVVRNLPEERPLLFKAGMTEVVPIGETDGVRDHFYAISVERRISHPAVAAITEAAREWLVRNN